MSFSELVLKYAPRIIDATKLCKGQDEGVKVIVDCLALTTELLLRSTNWEPPLTMTVGGDVHKQVCEIFEKAGVATTEEEVYEALPVFSICVQYFVTVSKNPDATFPSEIIQDISTVGAGAITARTVESVAEFFHQA